ncbi:hypothetical protein [Spirochaeta dissipatitropha]
MLLQTLVALSILLFFIVVPGTGALIVRQRWRTLRALVLESFFYPLISYSDQRPAAGSKESMFLGSRRMIATVDALEDDSILWVSNGRFSTAVEMKGQNLVLLSGTQDDLLSGNQNDAARSPVMVPWKRMFTINQGTQIYIAGQLCVENQQLRFRGSKNEPLLIILFEGDPRLVLFRTIWNARQRNEYYNQLTPGSMTLGSVALLLLSYLLFATPGGRLWGLGALTFSFSPVLPLLPPSVAGYYIFRRLWRRARVLRSQRDVLKVAHACCNSGTFNCRTAREDDPAEFRILTDFDLSERMIVELQQGESDEIFNYSLETSTSPEMVLRKLGNTARMIETAAVVIFLFAQLFTSYLLFVALSYAV